MLTRTATLCLTVALAAQAPSTDVAVGVFPFLVGNMDARVTEIATNCQTRGVDTVYVSIYRSTGLALGELWVTDHAGDWNAAWGAVRPGGAGINLPSLIAACHAVNVRVVGVLKCFNDLAQPTSAAHKQYLLDVIDYFVDAWQVDGRPVYDLDGLALDYVRYTTGTGNDPTQVTNFLADVRQHIGALSLHCYLVAGRFTFDGPTYDGNFNSYTSVINGNSSQYGQHWQQMAVHTDVMMPMSYTANGSIYSSTALHRAYVQQTAVYARQACTLAGFPTRRVCPVVRTYSDGSETATTTTIDASITGALLGGGDGYQSFRYQFLVDNPSWWTPMQSHAVPGCNWPLPVASTTSPTLTLRVDPSASRDSDQTAPTLECRIDRDGDLAFDTPWSPLAPVDLAPRYPGTWRANIQVRDATGHVSTTRRRYVAGPGLTLLPPFLSASNGGNAQLLLRTGPATAGRYYMLAASISGTSPGFTWAPGYPVPINPDVVTNFFLETPNSPILQGGAGLLDAFGNATALLSVPPGLLTGMAGMQVHWVFGVADGALQPICVSEADAMAIQP